jgi:hypothetical protein
MQSPCGAAQLSNAMRGYAICLWEIRAPYVVRKVFDIDLFSPVCTYRPLTSRISHV